MAVRWPAKIKPDVTPRSQFHHVNDIVPTIYEVLGITPPLVVNGFPQDHIDGVSLAYTFDDATAEGRLLTQYFEIMGSRGVYHKGWFASAFGPRIPWVAGSSKGIADWTPDDDNWELYNLEEDWSQANDLAQKMPEKLAQMKELFAIEFARNNGFPIGGGLWVLLHPEDKIATPYTEWTFPGRITRMPEFTAPALGTRPNSSQSMPSIPADANGVLYSFGAFSGGLTCYVMDGVLCYEYNLFEIARTQIKATKKLPTGKARSRCTRPTPGLPRPGGPMDVTLSVNGAVVAQGQVPISARSRSPPTDA